MQEFLTDTISNKKEESVILKTCLDFILKKLNEKSFNLEEVTSILKSLNKLKKIKDQAIVDLVTKAEILAGEKLKESGSN